jgi:hypothetical protein
MAFMYDRFTAAPAASANRFVVSQNMLNGAYTLTGTLTMPSPGGRKVTVTHTAVSTVDTLGVITITGTNLAGATITDVITPLNGTTATGVKFFNTITAIVGSGWTAVAGADTVTVGCDASQAVLDGPGTLHAVVVNSTAAGTVTLADSKGTIAVLKASIAEGTYTYDIDVGFLTVTQTAASDITVIRSGVWSSS